jgi:hypothetical protein
VQNELQPRNQRLTSTPLSESFLYQTFGPSWAVPCNELLLTAIPSTVCRTPPSPLPPQPISRCDQVAEVAEIVCKGACSSFAQCVHDVVSACNIGAAAGHTFMHNAVMAVWEGPQCEVQNPVCQNGCSGKGTCVANGVCVCEVRCSFSVHSHCLTRDFQAGHSGEDCSVQDCPANCNGRGECVNGQCCCHSWWTGADCNTPVCTQNCNGHGSCVGPDQCECYADPQRGFWKNAYCDACQGDYYGPQCNQRPCPNDCSGHGTCDHSSAVCTCENNWTGEDCSTFSPNLDQLKPVVQCRLPGPDVLPGSTAAIVFGAFARFLFQWPKDLTPTYAGVQNTDTIVISVPIGSMNQFSPGDAGTCVPILRCLTLTICLYRARSADVVRARQHCAVPGRRHYCAAG